MAVKITLGTQGKIHVTFRLKCLPLFYSTQVEPLQCFFFISNLRIQPSALIYWQNFVQIIVKKCQCFRDSLRLWHDERNTTNPKGTQKSKISRQHGLVQFIFCIFMLSTSAKRLWKILSEVFLMDILSDWTDFHDFMFTQTQLSRTIKEIIICTLETTDDPLF